MSGRRPNLQWSDGAAGPALRLAPVADPRSAHWRDFALCAETDPEAFFPEKGESTKDAKTVCRRCPVRDQCLEFALTHHERFGIWGGLSERERRQIEHERKQAA